MDLSVVVASIDARRTIGRCLDCLAQSCKGIDAELIVVDASGDGTSAHVATWGSPVRLICLGLGTLAPQLWAEGYRQSCGRVVAFTTAHCLVSPAWARSLIEALDAGASGAGGPLVLGSDTGPLDWAVFYLRYSAFTRERMGAGRTAGEIAGDNAAYMSEALGRHAASFEDGFWEIDFHDRLRADGCWLAAVPAAAVELGPSFPVGTIVRHRFAHGTHFGATRVLRKARAAWQVVLAAPAVPLLLAGRVSARVFRQPRDAWRFVAALPWFFLLASAWAAGEAWGAWRGNTAGERT